MQEQPTHPTVHGGFVRLGHQYRQAKDLVGAPFDEPVRGQFRKFLAKDYWNQIRAHLTESGWPLKEAVLQARLDPSRVSRWNKDDVPTFESICTLYANCELNMQDVKFPAGLKAFRSALLKTVAYIRSEYVEGPSADLNDAEWFCLFRALARPDILIPFTIEQNPDQVRAEMSQVYQDIAEEVQQQFPDGAIRNATGVQQAIRAWLIPVVLFYTVFPPVNRGACP